MALVIFAHPRRYTSPKKNPNDFDIGIRGYDVDDERPSYAALIVSPWVNHLELPKKLPSMNHYVGTAVGFRGFTKTPDMIIQVIIGHGPKGYWPHTPGVFIQSKGVRNNLAVK
ncbi:MAG: hypothetical protein WEC37_03070 [Anaerolineales bacterium]